MDDELQPFASLLSNVVDNRGKTCPTAPVGIPLIATNCVRNDLLYPAYEKVRFVDETTYTTWFRGHPQPGDLLFVTKGTPGRVCIVPDPVDFCIAQDMVAIRADPHKVYPPYLFALLRSHRVQAQIQQLHVGTLIPHFKKGDFDKLLLPIPGRKAQEFIGDTYFNLSAKIDLLRRMNETLEGMCAALFKAWFVDFEPVQAKADGAAQYPGVAADQFDALPATFMDADDGLLPAGWTRKPVSAVANVNDWTLGKRDSLPRIDYVEISEVMRGDVGSVKVFDRGREPGRAKRRLRHGDAVLSTVRPDRGAYFLCLNPLPSLVASTGFAVFTPKDVPWSFLYSALTRPQVIQHFGHLADGGAYPAIPPELMGGVKVALPPNETLLTNYHDICAPLYERADANRRESQTLRAIRDSLLGQLITGEVKVADQEPAEPVL